MVYSAGEKKLRFRGKVSTAGKEKIHIVIPALYRNDVLKRGFLGKIVEVEITEIEE